MLGLPLDSDTQDYMAYIMQRIKYHRPGMPATVAATTAISMAFVYMADILHEIAHGSTVTVTSKDGYSKTYDPISESALVYRDRSGNSIAPDDSKSEYVQLHLEIPAPLVRCDHAHELHEAKEPELKEIPESSVPSSVPLDGFREFARKTIKEDPSDA